MVALNERFVVDADGKKVAVVLDLEDYKRLLDELEELEEIRAYDAAKSSGETPVPFDQATHSIERDRA